MRREISIRLDYGTRSNARVKERERDISIRLDYETRSNAREERDEQNKACAREVFISLEGSTESAIYPV